MSTVIVSPPSVPPKPTGSGVSGSIGDGAYQLLRPIGPGRYGTAYLGVEPATGEPVEVRRLSATLDGAQREDLATRLRLIGLGWHRTARRVRFSEVAGQDPTLVLDHGGDHTLARYDGGASPAPEAILNALLDVAECLVETHHQGLTHGDLRVEAVGLAEGVAKLDFTDFGALGSGGSRTDASIGSPEAKAADCRAFAELVAWALDLEGVEAACRQASHRDAARLRQLGARAETATVELPEMSAFAECLHAVLAPSQGPGGSNQPPSDTTSELLGPPGQPVANDSTSEIVPPQLAGDGTSELGLTGPPAFLAPSKKEPQVGDRLGRFQIESKLGEGGMGAVFKATDLGSQQTVAIKVLSQAAMLRGNAVRRFAKEARLLASLNNPHITNLIEVSNEEGLHYIALEFVDGVDVSRVLESRGALPERVALSIAADVARALVDAHQREIVHRDIKPENILLVDSDAQTVLGDPPPRAKLADFGIARHIDQSESLAVTQAGSLLGTPKYMSPEQCRGQGEVMPQSDVYSLGVTLFELLSGQAPFAADDPMALAGKHCFDAPPALRKLVPDLSEPAAELVAKCLAKRPEDRFADASHLLGVLDRMLRGEPSLAALRTVMPDHDASRVVESTMTWRLASTPEALWPYVSNTERLNRAIGLPPVEYRTEIDPEQGVRRFGTVRIAGFSMTWEEHPFEWVEGRRMSVLREFNGGPFRWFVSTVELLPHPESGCELRHTVRILPRHTVGKLVAGIETGSKCRKSLDKVYRQIDTTLGQQRRDVVVDAFGSKPKLKSQQRDRLLTRIDALAAAGAPTEAVEGLTQFLLNAPDQEVAKIRPIALARRLGVDEGDLLDACLQAVTQGLLNLQWDLLCPTCRVAADTRDSLKQIEAHTHCEACDYDFQSDLSGAVELVFRAHAEIRDTAQGVYCVGGPWHAPHVVAQLRLEPGERVETEIALSPGEYVLRGPRLTRAYPVRVVSTGAPSQQAFVLGAETADTRTFTLRSGSQLLTIENDFDSQQVVRVERTISRDDVITAARASATPRFRELFPGEVFNQGRLVSAEQVTMLTAAIPSIDELYAERGDAAAFELVERHLADSSAVIGRHDGEVVKVIGETVFASFNNARRAVEAAFELSDGADDQPFRLAVGVHRGPALVTTANSRLDYFGATARQATALPTLTGAGVALTEPLLADNEAANWLAGCGREGELRTIDLPGKPGQIIQFYETE